MTRSAGPGGALQRGSTFPLLEQELEGGYDDQVDQDLVGLNKQVASCKLREQERDLAARARQGLWG